MGIVQMSALVCVTSCIFCFMLPDKYWFAVSERGAAEEQQTTIKAALKIRIIRKENLNNR